MKIQYLIDIQAPPAVVFGWLDDSEKLKIWMPSIVEDEVIDAVEGRVGSQFRQVILENGERIESKGTVTGYVQDERLAIRLENKGFELDVDYHLEPIPGGTRLTQTVDIRFLGMMKRVSWLISLVGRKSATGQLKETLTRLKKCCENEGGAPSPFAPAK